LISAQLICNKVLIYSKSCTFAIRDKWYNGCSIHNKDNCGAI